ncbi:MAG: YajD family HNH nuclease [Mariprofundaceae bacterium]
MINKASYREQALKLFPWICGRCAREFSGKKLRELTVHHKDHNHDNNPPDGSNWELLCIYCHDNEHSRYIDADGRASEPDKDPNLSYKPFGNLSSLLKKE